MHRTRVRVAEDALDANTTIAQANRADFDRESVAGGQPDERAGRGQDVAARGGASARAWATCARACWRATCRAGSTPTASPTPRAGHPAEHRRRLRRRVPPRREHGAHGAAARCALDEIDLLMIENVGNLVCPAEFRVGEDAKAMVCSVTEGEDKPLKYPLMFRTCELVVVNKIDLLPAPRLRPGRAPRNIESVNPGAEHHAGQRPHRRGGGRASATGWSGVAEREGAPA